MNHLDAYYLENSYLKKTFKGFESAALPLRQNNE